MDNEICCYRPSCKMHREYMLKEKIIEIYLLIIKKLLNTNFN